MVSFYMSLVLSWVTLTLLLLLYSFGKQIIQGSNIVTQTVSLVVIGITFASALSLSRKSSRILLQTTPKNISTDVVCQRIEQIPGVVVSFMISIFGI